MKIPEQAGQAGAGGSSCRAYLLIEALVYIGLVFVVLGAGYEALYRCIDNSVVLRRSVDDIVMALHAGERWRADVRAAKGQVKSETTPAGQFLFFETARNQVAYHCATNAVLRRLGAGPWTILLTNVASSTMQADRREEVTTWRWELELDARAKGGFKPGRIRPLFTFIGVPEAEEPGAKP